MKRMQKWFVAASVAAAVCLGVSQSLAQDNGGGGGGGGFGGGRRGNFDPAQFQQRMMDGIKEALEVTNDDEWKALQPMVQKVMDARMAAGSNMGRGMGMFMRRNRGGEQGGPGGGPGGDQGGRRGPFGQSSAEFDALQKAIDAKASKNELKAALTKFVETRKANEDKLKAAQDDLRKVLTARQEAIATLYGLL